MEHLAAVTIPLTADQSEEITQLIGPEDGGEPRRVFASVARNDDDPPLFDLQVVLQF